MDYITNIEKKRRNKMKKVANRGKDLIRQYGEYIRPILKKYGINISVFKENGYITPQGYIAFGKLRGVYNFVLDDSPADRLSQEVIDNICL